MNTHHTNYALFLHLVTHGSKEVRPYIDHGTVTTGFRTITNVVNKRVRKQKNCSKVGGQPSDIKPVQRIVCEEARIKDFEWTF